MRPNPLFRRPPLSAYAIAAEGDEATLNLYGEIVDTPPIDWFTGEPVTDGYIALSDFLPKLDELEGKRRVTVHINSVGGDLISGVAIYNRLKALSGEVVTICDSLAASAGSVIFQAGTVRQIYPSAAVMVHHALYPMCDMCNALDLRAAADELDGYDKQLINAYIERTGLDEAAAALARAREEGATVVWLEAGISTVSRRMGLGAPRSVGLGAPRAALRALMEEARAHYAAVADASVETDSLTPAQVADSVLRACKLADG